MQHARLGVEVWGAVRGGVGRRAGMELATGARVCMCGMPRRANLLLACLLACLLASFCVVPLTSPRREGPEIITQSHVEIHV